MAAALLRLIGLFTNLCFFGRWDTALVSPAGHRLGPWVVLVPVAGALVVGFMARYGSERKTLLVAGAAAGMSATFAAPVSAAALAVELLLFEWKPRSLIPVMLASATRARSTPSRMPSRASRFTGCGGRPSVGSSSASEVSCFPRRSAWAWIPSIACSPATRRSGTSGGVLAPLLMMGTALGGLESLVLPPEGAGFWPLVSMGAMLGGTMRVPFTAILFTVELTHDLNVMLPVLTAVAAGT